MRSKRFREFSTELIDECGGGGDKNRIFIYKLYSFTLLYYNTKTSGKHLNVYYATSDEIQFRKILFVILPLKMIIRV